MIHNDEPELQTEESLQPILEQLIRREPIFHREEFGFTRNDFENMTAPDFWEVGASGRIYSREFVLSTLEKRYSKPVEETWETTGFHCRKLGADVYLLTYTLVQNNNRTTRRATIWKQTEEGWKTLYHQGTIVSEEI